MYTLKCACPMLLSISLFAMLTNINADTNDNNNNNNIPIVTFITLSEPATVSEDASVGYFVGLVECDECTCSIEGTRFVLQLLFVGRYKIKLAEQLDREESTEHQVSVLCSANGNSQLTSTTSFTLHVSDVNDNAPTINVYTASEPVTVSEAADVDTIVGVVTCSDLDIGINSECSCSIRRSTFALELMYGSSYMIKLAEHLDREAYTEHSVTVVCSDRGYPPLTTTAVFTVRVDDENDNIPAFPTVQFQLRIDETTDVGDTVLNVQAYDVDVGANGQVSYSLDETGRTYFNIDSQSGRITAKAAIIDGSGVPPGSFKVIASDHGSCQRSGEAQVNIVIADK